jgi:hypothetical protein
MSQDLLMVSEQRIFLISHFDRAATVLDYGQQMPLHGRNFSYLRYQHFVTRSDTHSDSLAIFIQSARANSQYFSFIQLFQTALGQEDSSCSLRFCLHSLDEDAIEQGQKGLDTLECGRL